jgi:hypothetical protein
MSNENTYMCYFWELVENLKPCRPGFHIGPMANLVTGASQLDNIHLSIYPHLDLK